MDRNLLTRICSAVVVLSILYTIYYFFNTPGLVHIAFIVTFIGCTEFSKMFFNHEKKTQYFFNLTALISLVFFQFIDVSPIIYLALIIITIFVLYNHKDSSNTELQLQRISLLFTGYFYTVVFPFFSIKLLSLKNVGLSLFISLLAITFANDIFAYFSGKLFGKAKILPHISPKKTVAGSIGGVIGSAIISIVLLHFNFNYVSLGFALVIGVICAIAGQSGDFFASMLKRVSKVKDSGKIMPGHGGVLDRLDGVYFVAPIFYSLYYLFYSL